MESKESLVAWLRLRLSYALRQI